MKNRIKRPTTKQRRFIANRANRLCEYCLCPADFSYGSFVSEHIIPIRRGGWTDLDNLAFSCRGCNEHKNDKVSGVHPIKNSEHALYNPRRDYWEEHFAWEGLALVGKTAIGDVTCYTLQLNRESVVNIRRLLMSAGWPPPYLRDAMSEYRKIGSWFWDNRY